MGTVGDDGLACRARYSAVVPLLADAWDWGLLLADRLCAVRWSGFLCWRGAAEAYGICSTILDPERMRRFTRYVEYEVSIAFGTLPETSA